MFIGNQKSVKLLKKITASGKVGQAYLFAGPEAVGKFTLAKIFSRAVITNQQLITILPSIGMSGENEKLPVDLIILEPEVAEKKGVVKTKDISIEKIREAQKSLLLFPHEGKRKVLLVNDAHRLTEEAQSALLKTLEEPNTTSMIILVAAEEQKILPTIKSRCQKIKFNLVSPASIKEYLAEAGKQTAEKLEQMAYLSLGRPGLARKIIENGGEFAARREALEKLRSLPKAGINQRLKIAEGMSKNAAEAVGILELWIWSLHISAQKDARLFSIIGKLEDSAEDIKNTNASSRLILENLLLNL